MKIPKAWIVIFLQKADLGCRSWGNLRRALEEALEENLINTFNISNKNFWDISVEFLEAIHKLYTLTWVEQFCVLPAKKYVCYLVDFRKVFPESQQKNTPLTDISSKVMFAERSVVSIFVKSFEKWLGEKKISPQIQFEENMSLALKQNTVCGLVRT